eukprot:SM000131S26702  [mRNA]  locus=s131:116549:119936:+ [translate_table: standard]
MRGSLPPEGLILLFSCLVGLLGGAGVVLFNSTVHSVHDLAWAGVPESGATWLRRQPLSTSWQRILLVPTTGGLAVGLLNEARTLLKGGSQKAGERPGGGVASSRLRSLARLLTVTARPVLKALAAAVSLGTGSSLGPEGPSVEIGASIASGLGAVLKNSRERKLALVAAGSAAGIASGFNAAVAGCFFAVESVLRPSQADTAPSLTTAMILLSSVLASVVSQAGLGADPAFRIPLYEFRSPAELPLYLLLGVLCGGVSIALTRSSTASTQAFAWLRVTTGVPLALMPPLGGLSVGIIALAYPEVLYWGFANVDVLLESRTFFHPAPTALLLLQLVGAKVVATAVCRGSGLVGGVYAPSLFIGAALGSAYGKLASCSVDWVDVHVGPSLHLPLLSSSVATPQAYALVGMAATLAGVCQVPLTAVLLLFELTRDYRIILPLMGAVGISAWVAASDAAKQMQQKRKLSQLPPLVGQLAAAPAAPAPAALLTPAEESQESMKGTNSQSVLLRIDGIPTGPGLQIGVGLGLDSGQWTLQPQDGGQDGGLPAQTYQSELSEDGLCIIDSSLCLVDMEITEEELMMELPVAAAMRTRQVGYAVVAPTTTVGEAVAIMMEAREWCVLVLDPSRSLEGMLTLADVQQEAEQVLASSSGAMPLVGSTNFSVESMLVSSICSTGKNLVTASPSMTLQSAQRLMVPRGLRQLPVIDSSASDDLKLVIGILDRDAIRLACRVEATRRVLAKVGISKVEDNALQEVAPSAS